MAFSDRVNDATKGITTTGSVQGDTRTAFTTFQTSMVSVFTTYDLDAQDKQDFDDKLIDIARWLEAAMR